MTRIINLRGTNGSGKSWLATQLVPPAASERFEILQHGYVTKAGAARTKAIHAYRRDDMVLIGRYDTNCGGCDGLPDVRTAYRAALKASQMEGVSGVVLEGLMISGIYQSVVDELGVAAGALPRPATLVWAYLSTPLDECIARVRRRSNRPPEWDPRNIVSKHRAVVRTRERAALARLPVIDVRSDNDSLGLLRDIVRGASDPADHQVPILRPGVVRPL